MYRRFHQQPEVQYTGIFNDSFPPIVDGVTIAVDNYCRYLSQKGLSPLVVTPKNPVSVEVEYPVQRFFSLPIWNRYPYRYGYPKLDPFIWRRVRNTPFRIMHSHCPFSSGRLAVYVKRFQHVPLVSTFHSKYKSDLEHSFEKVPWMVPIIMKRILAFFNACDEVWIPQAAVEETVREYGFRGPVSVMENGCDFADAVHDNELDGFRKESRRKAGISPSTLSLLFVGQHIREKGILLIADALAHLQHKGIDFQMNFIGNGYATDELKERIKAHGLEEKVKIHGIVTDREVLKMRYAAADLFLFPSFYDNAPLVVREAAALGTPTLMLHGSTASEVIREGKNGFLTGNTAEGFAQSIVEIAKDREGLVKTGKNARQTLVRSWEDVVDEVAVRYERLIRDFK